MTVRLLGVTLALSATFWALPGAAPPAAGEDRKKQEAVFPTRDFAALPGKVVGVLASNGSAVLAQEGRKGPADTLCLGSGEGSYRWLYVPVPKKPLIGALNVRVGPRGETTRRFDSLGLANPRTVQKWGVTQPYTLVEVEVNGGQGAPPGENFVATDLRVVEGSREYPFKATAAVNRVRAAYEAALKDHESVITKALAEARKDVPPGRKPSGVRERTELVFVTWLPEQQRLRVVLQTRTAETAPGPVPTPAADSEDPAKRQATVFGAEWGMTFEVSRLDKTEVSRELPLRKFHNEILLPAPPQAGATGSPAARAPGR
jgi:hypothetical protein